MDDFFAFLNKSPTSFHAAKEIEKRLLNKGFAHVDPSWKLKKGSSYFLSKSGYSIAFVLPKKSIKKATILATHLDSPSLKIKPNPEIKTKGIKKLLIEVYGGPLLNTWTNRDLGIAGKVILKDQNKLKDRLIDLSDNPIIIPQLAIHLNKKANEDGVILNKQDHLCPIFSLSEQQAHSFKNTIEKKYGGKLIDFDLFLYPIEEARLVGVNSELIASYRLDNLSSAYAATHAMEKTDPDDHTLKIAVYYDHEEIGSMTNTGAFSPILNRAMDRIFTSYSDCKQEYYNMLDNSVCLSIDLVCGYNPNYADKYDENNTPSLGSGIAIKYSSAKKYATDCDLGSKIISLCEANKLKCQKFSVRSDTNSGSTLGPLFSATNGVTTADIGISCLSMHATREIISVNDQKDMCEFLSKSLQGLPQLVG